LKFIDVRFPFFYFSRSLAQPFRLFLKSYYPDVSKKLTLLAKSHTVRAMLPDIRCKTSQRPCKNPPTLTT